MTADPASEDYSHWRAEDYFRTYYSEVVLPDEQATLAYEIDVLRRAARPFGRGLEYGCGPTLHRTIAASRYAFRIDMADRLAENLAQVRAWLEADPSNGDWQRFTRHVLVCEGDPAPLPARIARREQQTRKVVRELCLSDARWRHPLGPAREGFYDLIVSGFCLDAVSADKRVWRRCMRNVLSTLAGGGLLILHALHRCRAYRVGDRQFPSADVSKDDLRESLLECGIRAGTLDLQLIPCPENAVYGYSGILVASGYKR